MTVLEHSSEAEHTCPSEIPEAIIREARRRGRRRRAVSGVAVLGAAGGLFGLGAVVLEGADATARGARSTLRLSARSSVSAADAVVAWGDYAGVLHLGDVVTRRQVELATLPASEAPSGWVSVDRGRLLWGDTKNRIRSLVIATGKTRVIARGTSVMLSPDHMRLFVGQGTRAFLELDSSTLRVIRRLTLPTGWTTYPWALPIAGGFLVTRKGPPYSLGLWRVGGTVRQLGASLQLVAAYTAPGGRSSLVAWVPSCSSHANITSHCPLAITNTVTGHRLTVPSPSRWGFTGGAFSPSGSEFATFVNTDNPSDSSSTPRSELAIVDTRTGTLRLDRKVKLTTTEDAAWAAWLKSGNQLLTGAIEATDLVNASSLATRPFYFDGSATRLQSIMTSPDLNFSTIAIPPSALSLKQRRALGLTTAAKKNST